MVSDRSASRTAVAVLGEGQINLSLDGGQLVLGNGVVWVRSADTFELLSLALELNKSLLDGSALRFAGADLR